MGRASRRKKAPFKLINPGKPQVGIQFPLLQAAIDARRKAAETAINANMIPTDESLAKWINDMDLETYMVFMFASVIVVKSRS